MKKQIVFLCLVIVFLFPKPALAARNISITSDKSALANDDLINISASLSGFTDGEKLYVKGAFFKEGSTNYFGYTKYQDSWIKNSVSVISQRQVEIGNWDNQIQVRPDVADAGYRGSGDYKLKIGFYYFTGSGNTSSVNWSSNNLSINLDVPLPSPTNTPTPKTSDVNKSTSVQVSKTPSPTNTKLFLPPTIKPISESSSKNGQNFDKISSNLRTASQYASIKPITHKDKVNKKTEVLGEKDTKHSYFLSFLFGVLFMLVAGVLILRNSLKERGII